MTTVDAVGIQVLQGSPSADVERRLTVVAVVPRACRAHQPDIQLVRQFGELTPGFASLRRSHEKHERNACLVPELMEFHEASSWLRSRRRGRRLQVRRVSRARTFRWLHRRSTARRVSS